MNYEHWLYFIALIIIPIHDKSRLRCFSLSFSPKFDYSNRKKPFASCHRIAILTKKLNEG